MHRSTGSAPGSPGLIVVLLALIAAATFPLAANGQTNEPKDTYGRHDSFGRITPYVWFSNINGRAGIDDTIIHVGDDRLNTNFAIQAEYGKGRWRVVFEASRGKVANTAIKGVDPTSTGGHCCGPDQVARVDGPYELAITSAELLASIQVGPFWTHRGIEVQGGFRYTDHNLNLALTDPVLVGTFSESWIEPVVGLRYYTAVGSKVWFTMRTNIGGFGMGPEFTWLLDGEVGYRVGRDLDVSLRYKYLETDYKNSSMGLDQYDWQLGQSQGWLMGVSYKW
ncbi:MAG: hypothetical protein GKS06_11560 [Acidobacteria bacterium]|nr:hypothetical protein [Acidobacteriota bacterium]